MRLRTALAACACLVLGCAAFYVSWVRAPDSPRTFEAKLIREGQAAYRSISAWARFDNPERVRAALEALVVSGPPLDTDRADRLRELIAGFLVNRFGQGSPAVYRNWRSSRAASWAPFQELKELWLIGIPYQRFVGSPLPPDLSQEEAFDRLWEAHREHGSGHYRLVAVAAESKGLAALHGFMTPTRQDRGFLKGAMTTEQWHGAIAITNCSWWRPARDTRALLKEYGKAEYVDVGLVVECADGSRRPLIITVLWDPVDQVWSLVYLNVNNTEMAEGFEGIDF